MDCHIPEIRDASQTLFHLMWERKSRILVYNELISVHNALDNVI